MLSYPTLNVLRSYLKIHFFGGLFLHSHLSFFPPLHTLFFFSFLIIRTSLVPSFYSTLPVNSFKPGHLILFKCHLKTGSLQCFIVARADVLMLCRLAPPDTD